MGTRLIIVAALIFAGCAPVPVVTTDFCSIAKPIYIDSLNDKLTDTTAREILAHDRTYAALCGKPSGAKK